MLWVGESFSVIEVVLVEVSIMVGRKVKRSRSLIFLALTGTKARLNQHHE